MLKLVFILIILVILICILYKSYISESFQAQKLNIIQTWKTDQVPNKYQPMIKEVKRLNPKSNYIFFNDEDIIKFISNHYPQYLDIFKNFPYTIQKIDFFRYLAVYHYGGVYLDLDISLKKSLSELMTSSKCIFPLEFLQSTDMILHKQGFSGLVGNYAFYAPKGHPFLKKIIENIVNKRINIGSPNNDNFHKYIYYTTGPVMVTQSYLDYGSKDDISLIRPYPFRKSCFGDFGKHTQFGSWKK